MKKLRILNKVDSHFRTIQEYLLQQHPQGLVFVNADRERVLQTYPTFRELITDITECGTPYEAFRFTTHDPLTTQYKSYGNTKRSSGDLFLIAWHYFPETTYKQVFNLLETNIKERKIGAIFCCDISKRVYCSYKLYESYDGYKGAFMFKTEFDKLVKRNMLLSFHKEIFIPISNRVGFPILTK